jgi:DNA-binding NarL/FixJ family response regulator
LTPRELEILGMVARGMNNQAIADELVLTKRAVEKHINEIFRKLELTSAPDVSHRVKATLIVYGVRLPVLPDEREKLIAAQTRGHA